MAIKPFNSVDGITVGNTSIDVVYANGDVSATNLIVSGNSTLGSNANVKITGGTNNQVLSTDGAGNLSWKNSGLGNFVATMPTYIATSESYTVQANFQGLYGVPIEIDGELIVDGTLVEVVSIHDSNISEVVFNDGNGYTSNSGLTFIQSNTTLIANNLSVTSIANLGNVGNVKIIGGTAGQYLQTDGTGNLLWASAGGGGGGNGTPGGVNTQVQFNDDGNFAGNVGFTFNKTTGLLTVPNVAVSGDIIPTANVTYSLGNNTNRFNDLYLSGTTITLGNSTLSANSTAVVITNPAGGTFSILGTGLSSTSLLANGNSNVSVASNSSIGISANGVSNVLLVTKSGVDITGNLGVTGDITGFGNVAALGSMSATDLTATGNLNVTGDVSASNLSITGSFEASGNLSGININTSGDLSVLGNANISTNLKVTGTTIFSSQVTVGNPLGISNVNLYPNGYGRFTKLDVVNGNITGNNLSLDNNLSIGSNLTVSGTANIVTLLTSGVNSLGNVTAGNIVSNGIIIAANANLGNLVSANFFEGDGHLLTNLTIAAGSAIVNGNSNVSIAPNANVTVSVAGVDNIVTFTSSSLLLDGNMSTSGNITAGNITLNGGNGGYLYTHHIANGNTVIDIDSANYVDISINNSNVFTVTSAGTATTGRSNVSGKLTVAGDTSLNTASVTGLFRAYGNLIAANIDGGTLVKATYLEGDGYLISNLTIAAGSSIINGNSNVNIAPNANVTITAEGNANVITVTGNSVIFDKKISGPLANFTTANVTGLSATSLFVQNALNINANVTANGSLNANSLVINSDTPNGYYGSGSVDGNFSVGTYLFVSGYSNLHTINATSLNISGSIDANNTVHGNYVTATFDITASRNLYVDDNLTVSGNTSLQRTNVNGNLNAINVNANLITGNFLVGDGYLISNLTVPAGTALLNGTSNLYVDGSGNVRVSVDGSPNVMVVTSTGVNVAGTLSASGNANISNLGTGRILATGNITAAAVISNGNISGTNVSATGNITATNANLGNSVSANFFIGDGYLLSNLTIPAGTAITNGGSNVLVTANSNVNITINGTANVVQVAETGMYVSGNLIATGDIVGATFSNGSSNIAITNNGPIDMSINGTDGIFSVRSTGTYANVKVYALAGLSVAGNSNIGNLGVSGSITTPNEISSRDLTASGNLDVSGNANLATARITGALTSIGNVVGGNLITSGIANVETLFVGAGGANINGYTKITGNIDVTGNINVTGNLNYSNVTDLVVGDPLIYIGANNTGDLYDLGIVASYNDGTYVHTGLARNHNNGTWTFFDNVVQEPTTVIDWANATMATMQAGNVTTSNLTVTGNISANYFNGNVIGNITGNVSGPGSNTQVIFNDAGTLNATSGLTFNKSTNALTVSGNITGANLITSGQISATGNITTANTLNLNATLVISANGESRFWNRTTYVDPDLSVERAIKVGANGIAVLGGIKTDTLTATGNANVGNLRISGLVSATGNITAGNIITTGVVTATGNTSGGNLTTPGALSVTGNANIGNIGTSGLITATGNIQGANLVTIGIISATGNALVGNLSANIGSFTGNVSAGNIAGGNLITANYITGEILTAAQPNITSLGVLSSLTATGNISGGNLLGIFANGNSNVRIPSSNGNVNISSAGNANILVITGTGANITGTANITGNLSVGGKSNLGSNGNIIIAGGTSGYVLSTDGSGNLSWVAQSGGGGGSANIAIYDQGNLLSSSVGSMNFVGDGITATSVGNAVTVTVNSGGGGPAAITLDSYTATGLQTAFTLSVAPVSKDYTFVNIDGVDQLKSSYDVTDTTLTMTSAPYSGAKVEITTVSGLSTAQPSFTTRNYTGNSVQTAFTVTDGVTATGVLVTLNGLLQTPTTDYTVSGSLLTFSLAPATSQAIQIRELGTVVASASSGGVTSARALGYSLVFGL